MIVANQTDALRIIKDSVTEFLPESEILLFGSRARKDFSDDSDFDLMIVTNLVYKTRDLRLLKATIRKRLAQNRIPADIIIQSRTELEINKNITGHIVKQVLKEGIPI